MFLRITDFSGGEYNIPNVDGIEYDPAAFGNTEILQSFIDKYEPKALILMLGYDFYLSIKELVNLNNENRLKDDADDIYDKLINGDESVGYNGIIEALRAFVYYHYLRHISETLTSTGVKKIESKSATIYSVRYKMTDAMNDFKMIVSGIGYNEIDVRVFYGNLISVNYNEELKNTIHGYILEHSEDYPLFTKNVIEAVNRFDI